MTKAPFGGVIALRAAGIEVVVAVPNLEDPDVNSGAYSADNGRGA